MRRTLLPLLLLASCGEGADEGFSSTAGGARQEPYVAVPPGSVPRSASAHEALLEPPGPEVTPALLRLGARVYRDSCLPCHGRHGLGDGPVVEKGFPRPPPFAAAPQPPARTVAIVTEGVGEMPALPQIDPVERWAVAWFVARGTNDGE